MKRRYLLLLLLLHVGHGSPQFNDFFPSFSIFSYTTPRPTIRHSQHTKPKTDSSRNIYNNVYTTKPTTSRREYNDDLYNIGVVRDTDRKPVIDSVYNYDSTEKTIKKTTKYNSGRTFYNAEASSDTANTNTYKNGRKPEYNDVNIVVQDYTRDNRRHYEDNTNLYNNFNNYNHKTTHNYYELTTKNPYYERPGVKPSIIENRPPITNKPAITRPSTLRTTTLRTTTRRPYIVPPRPTDFGAVAFPDDDVTPEVLTGPDEDSMSEVDKMRYVELAERKCDTYKSLNMKQVQAIPLLPSPEPVQVNVTSCAPTNIPLVVGGKIVGIGDFPHMALLGWPNVEEGGYSWKCGGSLVSDQYVLTAAHCSYQERDNTVVTGPPRVVQLGSSYLDDPGALVMRVGAVIRHPRYKPNRSYYDIALLKLTTTVKFSELIKPACLGTPPHAGKHIIATGWGQTQLGGNQSQELRSVSLPVWDIASCARALGTSRKMPSGPSAGSQLCAGEPHGGKDTCQGDSGGPAQIQEGCIWRIVAVTSIGRSCAAPNTPGLYSLIHLPFVAAQIFGGHRNRVQDNQHSNNNQNSYNTQNNNQNNYNTQGQSQIDNQNSYNTQNNNHGYDNNGQHNANREDKRPDYNNLNNNQNYYNTQASNQNSNTQNDNQNSYNTQNNNQRYDNGNNRQQSNLNKQDRRHDYSSEKNNQNNEDRNNNYEKPSSRNVNVDSRPSNGNIRTENNRFGTYDNNPSNFKNSDRYTSRPTNYDNNYRNNQENSRTEDYNNKQPQIYDNNNQRQENSRKTTYSSYDKPIWWT